ncbi:MAG: hypothetical protein JWR51_1120 [Devosia sp.]|nr:hypothetical protein [Devosia sp.]
MPEEGTQFFALLGKVIGILEAQDEKSPWP